MSLLAVKSLSLTLGLPLFAGSVIQLGTATGSG